MSEVATLPSQTGRMSPGAVALAVGLHVAVAGALWWLAPLDREDHAETPIMVTVEPQPLGGSGATASSGGGAPPTETAETPPAPPTPPAEPVQQATAVAEPAPAAPTEPPPQPAAAQPPERQAEPQPQVAEPLKPSEEETETKWQTEASAWKPHVTFENALPPPDAPPPPTSRDIPRPRPQQQARPPVQQRAQTAFPPRPVQPPAAQPGNTQTAASTPGPTNSALDSLSGHGGERNDYLTRVFRHIEPFRVYPEAARANRQRGRVVTRVTINRAGELVAVSIDRSSGWPLIDNAELAAIRRAMPLPPPPAGMPGDPLVLILPMNYNYDGR